MKSVFPEDDAKHLSFILVDDGGNEIFSVNRSSVTDEAVKNLKSEWSNGEPVAVDSLKYAASSSRCGSNWHVISVSDFSARNSRYLRILIYCASILGVSVVIVFFVGLLLSSSKMPDNIIYRGQYSTESIDKLTGLIMNEALENVIVDKIDRCINGTTMVFMLVSIKNYGLINENYGENAVDEALVKAEAVKHAYISYVLADHSKFGQISSVTFADISNCCIITDREVSKNYSGKTIIKVIEAIIKIDITIIIINVFFEQMQHLILF